MLRHRTKRHQRGNMKEVRFTEPMYQADISYLVGGDVPELIAFIKERHGNELPVSWSEKFEWGEDAHTTDGYQFHINAPLGKGETFYVWMAEKTPSLLFHETFHLVGDILHTRGINYSNDSEEAYAYLGGWIFQEAFRQLRGTFRKR